MEHDGICHQWYLTITLVRNKVSQRTSIANLAIFGTGTCLCIVTNRRQPTEVGW